MLTPNLKKRPEDSSSGRFCFIPLRHFCRLHYFTNIMLRTSLI